PDNRHFNANSGAWNGADWVATANYVGGQGARDGQAWYYATGTGSRVRSGVFRMNGGTRLKDVVDGTSKTFAIGERTWECNAAAWVGNRNPAGNGFQGHYYTLGVVGDSQTDNDN